MGAPTGPVQGWSVKDVAEWLASLELPENVLVAFKENAVAGEDLLTLSDEDLKGDLGLTSLQARKVRNALAQLGVAAPAAAAAAPAAAPTPAPAAPAPVPAPAAPAAPAPAPAPAPAGEPDPRRCFALEDLQRYRQLDGQLRDLRAMQVPQMVEQARRYATQKRQGLEGAQRAVPPARQAAADAKEAFDKLAADKWYPGKVLGGKDKHTGKKEEAQAALDAANQRAAAAEQAVHNGQAELAEAEKQLAAWRGKESELATAERTQQELFQRMFAAPVWSGSPAQNALVDAARALEAQAAEAGRGVATYGNGHKLLAGAAAKIEGAIKSLRGTQFVNIMGMGRGGFGPGLGGPGRGNMMESMAEMAILRRANDQIASAAQDTQQARQLLGPGLPAISEDVLKAARAGIFANVLFRGMAADMMQMAAVAKSTKECEVLLAQVNAAAAWAQSNLAVYQHKEAEARGAVAAKQGELQAFRVAALKTALDAAPAPAAAGGAVPPIEQLSLI